MPARRGARRGRGLQRVVAAEMAGTGDADAESVVGHGRLYQAARGTVQAAAVRWRDAWGAAGQCAGAGGGAQRGHPVNVQREYVAWLEAVPEATRNTPTGQRPCRPSPTSTSTTSVQSSRPAALAGMIWITANKLHCRCATCGAPTAEQIVATLGDGFGCRLTAPRHWKPSHDATGSSTIDVCQS